MKKLNTKSKLLALAVLCTITIFSVSAVAQQQLPLKGTLTGVEVDQFEPPNTIVVNGTGSGNATHLGLFTVEYEVSVDLGGGRSIKKNNFVSDNGDSLFCEGNGKSNDTAITGGHIINEFYTITSDT